MTQADVVVPGRVPGIHVLRALQERRGWPGKAWVAGIGPAKTMKESVEVDHYNRISFPG